MFITLLFFCKSLPILILEAFFFFLNLITLVSFFVQFYFIYFFIQQALIGYLFYTYKCIYVNPRLAIHPTTTTLPLSPLGVHNKPLILVKLLRALEFQVLGILEGQILVGKSRPREPKDLGGWGMVPERALQKPYQEVGLREDCVKQRKQTLLYKSVSSLLALHFGFL